MKGRAFPMPCDPWEIMTSTTFNITRETVHAHRPSGKLEQHQTPNITLQCLTCERLSNCRQCIAINTREQDSATFEMFSRTLALLKDLALR